MELFQQSYKNISADDVSKIMNEIDVQVIDVRETYEFSNGHIDVALSIPLGSIPDNMDQLDKSKRIVLVCASGGRSTSAANYLSQYGYEVYNMVGGMMGWRFAVAR